MLFSPELLNLTREYFLKVVLFDLDTVWERYNSWSWEMLEKTGIGIPDHDSEAKRCVLFGFLTTWFLGEVSVTFVG